MRRRRNQLGLAWSLFSFVACAVYRPDSANASDLGNACVRTLTTPNTIALIHPTFSPDQRKPQCLCMWEELFNALGLVTTLQSTNALADVEYLQDAAIFFRNEEGTELYSNLSPATLAKEMGMANWIEADLANDIAPKALHLWRKPGGRAHEMQGQIQTMTKKKEWMLDALLTPIFQSSDQVVLQKLFPAQTERLEFNLSEHEANAVLFEHMDPFRAGIRWVGREAEYQNWLQNWRQVLSRPKNQRNNFFSLYHSPFFSRLRKQEDRFRSLAKTMGLQPEDLKGLLMISTFLLSYSRISLSFLRPVFQKLPLLRDLQRGLRFVSGLVRGSKKSEVLLPAALWTLAVFSFHENTTEALPTGRTIVERFQSESGRTHVAGRFPGGLYFVLPSHFVPSLIFEMEHVIENGGDEI